MSSLRAYCASLPTTILFERNCGGVIPREPNDDDDSTKFTAQFLERQSICIELVENIPYMLINITRGLQTRMERPEAVLPFDLSATNGVTCPCNLSGLDMPSPITPTRGNTGMRMGP
jgi:hypothetical protein